MVTATGAPYILISSVLTRISLDCDSLGSYWGAVASKFDVGFDSTVDESAAGVNRHLRRLAALSNTLEREAVPAQYMPAKASTLAGLSLLVDASNVAIERLNAEDYYPGMFADVASDILRAGVHFATARRQLSAAERARTITFQA